MTSYYTIGPLQHYVIEIMVPTVGFMVRRGAKNEGNQEENIILCDTLLHMCNVYEFAYIFTMRRMRSFILVYCKNDEVTFVLRG